MNDLHQLNKAIELFVIELTEFKYQINLLEEYEDKQKKINNKNRMIIDEEPKEKKLQSMETEYDQIHELYLRYKYIEEIELVMKEMINYFQNHLKRIVEISHMKKEEYGNNMNDLLKEIKQIEEEIKEKEYTKEYKLNNYKNLLIETEKMKIIQEEKKKMKEHIRKE